MKRVALWIVTIAFAFVVMSSAPVHAAVKWDKSGPDKAANNGTTISTGESDPTESGTGDDGDADGVAGLKDPSRGMSALPEIEQRFVLLLRSWWMLFLKR
jgi:hypothetical protein